MDQEMINFIYTFSASNSSLGNALKGTAALAGVPIPQFLADFVNPIIFGSITIKYWRTDDMATYASLQGSPLVTKESTPLLYWMLRITKSNPSDLVLSVSSGGVSFVMVKVWVFNLPKPFINPDGGSTATLAVGFTQSGASVAFEATATLLTSFRLPGVVDPVLVSGTLGLSVDHTLMPALVIGGDILSPVVLADFPWVSLTTMGVMASFDIPPLIAGKSPGLISVRRPHLGKPPPHGLAFHG
jgi:hypothetical protein